MDLPIVMGPEGYVPQTPASLNQQLIAAVEAVDSGYTANLPGSLIEDVSSTNTYSLLTCDSAFGDLVNSVTPLGANAFILAQLGAMLGLPLGTATNTSVSVVFSGPPGFVIAQGFTVSDGTYQYIVQDGGIIQLGGSSASLFAVATQSGTWAVPAASVSQLVTSVPSTLSPALTVTNPFAGTPSTAAETQTNYRARVLQANLAASQGMARYLKTLLGAVPGVQSRLVSVLQQPGVGWMVICGGGDPYAVAYAIYTALFDVSTLVGSTLGVLSVTQANPGVVTTTINHGFANGQAIQINYSNPINYNGSFTIEVLSETTFSLGVDTSNYLLPYEGGGVVTPNLRNVAVSINDYPNTYLIPFINPPQETVAVTATWNTSSASSVNAAVIGQLAGAALVDYINGITAGQPINTDVMVSTFSAAIASVLAPPLLTRLVFSVSINGVGTAPVAGTVTIFGDPSSYFETTGALVTVLQG